MHASISHARCSLGYPSPWWAWPVTPFLWHWIRTQSPATGRGDCSVRRRLPALVGRQRISDPCFNLIDDSRKKAPQALGTRTSAASVRDSGSVPWPYPGGKHDADVEYSRQIRPHRDGTGGSAPTAPRSTRRAGATPGPPGPTTWRSAKQVRERLDPIALGVGQDGKTDRRCLAPLVAAEEQPVLAVMLSSS